MKWWVGFTLAVALAAPACSDPVAPATPTPATPTIPETFTGTVLPLGNSMNTFTVQQVGGIQVSLTNVSPPASVGIGVGTPSGANCLLLDNLTVVAGPNAQMSGTATVTGNFCVSVFDPGNLVESVNYTVVVLHS
ncbi:MAG TPA: hypothetical protein VKD69_11495 [Vicinamibacterales bacterium]|nr:hypothetical protein [Vicinamibacterales bacterium]